MKFYIANALAHRSFFYSFFFHVFCFLMWVFFSYMTFYRFTIASKILWMHYINRMWNVFWFVEFNVQTEELPRPLFSTFSRLAPLSLGHAHVVHLICTEYSFLRSISLTLSFFLSSFLIRFAIFEFCFCYLFVRVSFCFKLTWSSCSISQFKDEQIICACLCEYLCCCDFVASVGSKRPTSRCIESVFVHLPRTEIDYFLHLLVFFFFLSVNSAVGIGIGV